MGTYIQGILGNFTGKVGTVIGSRWRGIHYMKARSGPRKGSFSESQLAQQTRFALATRFMQPLHPVLQIGYRSQSRTITALNCALRDVLKEVITGTYPDYEIDYATLRIAKGTLVPAGTTQMTLSGSNVLITWTDPVGQAGALPGDRVLLTLLAETGEPGFSLLQYQRSDGTATLALPTGISGTVVHGYLAMVTTDGGMASNSVYLGSVTVN